MERALRQINERLLELLLFRFRQIRRDGDQWIGNIRDSGYDLEIPEVLVPRQAWRSKRRAGVYRASVQRLNQLVMTRITTVLGKIGPIVDPLLFQVGGRVNRSAGGAPDKAETLAL